MIALLTRSLLSFTAVSGKPTIDNAGRPLDRWTSTVTSGALMPTSARVYTWASDTLARDFFPYHEDVAQVPPAFHEFDLKLPAAHQILRASPVTYG